MAQFSSAACVHSASAIASTEAASSAKMASPTQSLAPLHATPRRCERVALTSACRSRKSTRTNANHSQCPQLRLSCLVPQTTTKRTKLGTIIGCEHKTLAVTTSVRAGGGSSWALRTRSMDIPQACGALAAAKCEMIMYVSQVLMKRRGGPGSVTTCIQGAAHVTFCCFAASRRVASSSTLHASSAGHRHWMTS